VADQPPFCQIQFYFILCPSFWTDQSPDFWLGNFFGDSIRWVFIFRLPCLIFAGNIGISFYYSEVNSRFRSWEFRLGLDWKPVSAVIGGTGFGVVVGHNSDGVQGELLDLQSAGGNSYGFSELFVLSFCMKRAKNPLLIRFKLFSAFRLFIACFGWCRLPDTSEPHWHNGENSSPRWLPWNEEFDAPQSHWRSTLPNLLLIFHEIRKCYWWPNVRSVLAHNCYRMSFKVFFPKIPREDSGSMKKTYFKGGENGPVYISGNTPKVELNFAVFPFQERIKMLSFQRPNYSSKRSNRTASHFWIDKRCALARSVPQQSLYRSTEAPEKTQVSQLPRLWIGKSNWIGWLDHVISKTMKLTGMWWSMIAPSSEESYPGCSSAFCPVQEDLPTVPRWSNPQKRRLICAAVIDQKEDYTAAFGWPSGMNILKKSITPEQDYITRVVLRLRIGFIYNPFRDKQGLRPTCKELLKPQLKNQRLYWRIRGGKLSMHSQRIGKCKRLKDVGQRWS